MAGRRFCIGTKVPFTDNIGTPNITAIMLKVALNTYVTMLFFPNKRKRKPKERSRLKNLENQVILGTRRRTKTSKKNKPTRLKTKRLVFRII